MASIALLRTCSRGTQCLLLRVQSKAGVLSHETANKIFTTSSTMGALDYFRARRGPFTPEEKRGSGHLMMASTHWKVERVVAVAMVGIMPACLFVQGPMMDHLLTTFVYLHGHWGMRGVLTDYLVKFVPWIQYLWYVISILGFAGLINFNFNDVGITKAIQMLWSI
ncbi:hypothetical protein BaRGS_00037479 [Batillaria attramentaria]|uniref:Succinate dehydrogenase [ubiquinone] cytochrome b small subunit n=1 Tax=Batillaria attramentaria TaxID=370345 RepID=A0ABD0J8K3_9CAEN